MTGTVVDEMYLTKIARIYDGHSGGCNVFDPYTIIYDGHSGGCNVFDSNSNYL